MEKQFIEIDSDNFSISPRETKPIEGYGVPKNKKTGEIFPYCCSFHRDVFEVTERWFSDFINDSEEYKKLISREWFNINNYSGLAEKVVKQLSYTEHHIIERINIDEWYKDITDYIEYNILSFGHPNLGVHFYLWYLKHFIKNTDTEISTSKRKMLISYIDSNNEKPDFDKPNQFDFNLLSSIYMKWLKTFPFEISFFAEIKPYFEKQLPILNGKPEINKYTGFAKAQLHTKTSLIDALVNLTRNLLEKINITELRKKGEITDVQANILEFTEAELNTEIAKITKQYSKGELKYVKALKKWLQLHKDYFKELAPLLKNLPPKKIDESVTVKYTAKHYVLSYLIECNAKGEKFPVGQKKELEKIGNKKMGVGKGNRFYKVFNEVVDKDLNVENSLIEIGGENWRTIVKDLSNEPEIVEAYLQSKQL